MNNTRSDHPSDLYEVTEIAKRAFVATPTDGWGWYLSNAGWIVGDESTLVVDTFVSHRRTSWLLNAVDKTRAARGVSGPVTVALTHAHGDHANGAYLFEENGAQIMAAAGAKHEASFGIQRFPQFLTETDWGEVRMPSSISAVSDTSALDLAGVRAVLNPSARAAHTAGDLTVTCPSDVLWAGDLVWNEVTPLSAQGSVAGWLVALDELSAGAAGTVVPGHGAVGGPALIEQTAAYLRWILRVARVAIKHRLAAAESLGLDARSGHPWHSWPCGERDVVNVMAAMAELAGEPVDLVVAIDAMVRAAGGRFAAPS